MAHKIKIGDVFQGKFSKDYYIIKNADYLGNSQGYIISENVYKGYKNISFESLKWHKLKFIYIDESEIRPVFKYIKNINNKLIKYKGVEYC